MRFLVFLCAKKNARLVDSSFTINRTIRSHPSEKGNQACIQQVKSLWNDSCRGMVVVGTAKKALASTKGVILVRWDRQPGIGKDIHGSVKKLPWVEPPRG